MLAAPTSTAQGADPSLGGPKTLRNGPPGYSVKGFWQRVCTSGNLLFSVQDFINNSALLSPAEKTLYSTLLFHAPKPGLPCVIGQVFVYIYL